MQQVIGSHLVLTALPQWLTFGLLALLTWGVVFVGRVKIEGLGYNVSWASVIGDVMLIMIVGIAAAILQRGPVDLPGFWTSGNFHLICLFVAFIAGLLSLVLPGTPIGSKTAMDVYHGSIVVPLFFYLLLSVAPVIWSGSRGGLFGEVWLTIFFLLAWGGLMIKDSIEGSLDQPGWLRSHNVTWTKPVEEVSPPPRADDQ
jgi:hypothetical protein